MTSAAASTDRSAPQDLETGLLIGERWRQSSARFTVRDKFSGQAIAEVSEASAEEVSEAVTAAVAAFKRGAPVPRERAAILRRARDLLAEARPLFVSTIIAETGFTHTEANNEVDRSLITLELSAEEATRITGEMVPFASSPGQESRIGFTMRFPLGVVCAITPFNSPLNTVMHKVAPAFAAGNAVVLKPSVFTPLTGALLCRILVEAGMPAGFINLVQGSGSRIGNLLLQNQAIAFYAFTGSTRVGLLVQQHAGLRRCQLELGSIASTIVCADADLALATTKIGNAGFRKAGQVCTSVQLVFVERPVLAEMSERLLGHVSALKVGDPHQQTTTMGPLIDEAEADRVCTWVKEAKSSGARVITGGERSRSLVQPVLLDKIDRSMKVFNREIFGPVISLVPFDSIDEAVDGANASEYGLAAGIFTRDISRGLRVAQKMRFGGVHINEASSSRADGMPFGGVKQSGFGREGPRYAIAEMSEERLITLNP